MSRPRFSIVTPVFDPDPEAFRRCIASVVQQSSTDWEWIVVDDGSSDPQIGSMLDELAAIDGVSVTRLAENCGIVGASNLALDHAEGEFVAFLDHDDELTTDALETLECAIIRTPDVDFIYTDEAKIDMNGNQYDWFAKPEWSPERLRGQNYCNHLSVYRRTLVSEVGGLRPGFDGAQDHDLVLRVTERTDRIVHVPEVLYLWRAGPGSTASRSDAKPHADEAGRRAVSEHLERQGISAEVVSRYPGRYTSIRQLRERPLVSIIVPTRGDIKRVSGTPINLVENAVRSVITCSSYQPIEVVVVYDSVTPPETLHRLADLCGDRIRLVEWSGPFNFSKKMNLGVVRSSGGVVVLLNDDTEVISPNWIETLVGLLQERDVGMVGPMLLLADGRIQSAGHHNAPTPMNLAAGAPIDDPGPHAMFTVAGERTGVTAACAALRRDVYLEVGGLSDRFANCYNDVDLAFKLLECGYRIVWTPDARLRHFESLTRNPRETPAEAEGLRSRWERRLGNDPFARQIDEWWAEVPFIPPPTRTASDVT